MVRKLNFDEQLTEPRWKIAEKTSTADRALQCGKTDVSLVLLYVLNDCYIEIYLLTSKQC